MLLCISNMLANYILLALAMKNSHSAKSDYVTRIADKTVMKCLFDLVSKA